MFVLASNVLSWSYQTSNPCTVIVGENSEISAAKSVISETNRSTSSRPKPSIASTTSSTQTNSATSGGKNLLKNKRFRRNIDRNFYSSSSSNYYFSSTTEMPLHDNFINFNTQSSTIDDGDDYIDLSSSTNNGVTNNNDFLQLTTDESFDDLLQNDDPSLLDINFNDVQSLDIDNEKLKTLYNKDEIDENIIFHPLIEKKEKIDKTKWKNEENEIGKYGLIENSPIFKVHDANNNLTAKHDGFSNKITTQRILVNISIATDGGSGTTNHAVYVLNVAVPADSNGSPKLYDPNNNDDSNESLEQSFVPPPEPPPAPPCPCNCNSNILENLENSFDETTTSEGSGDDDSLITTTSTNDDEFNSTTIVDESILNETFSCPDFLTTPILILEGERVLLRTKITKSSINKIILLIFGLRMKKKSF